MKPATYKLINTLAKKISAKTYLEIGIRSGETFFNVDLPHKTAVDPKFLFKVEDHHDPRSFFFPDTSDTFFSNFPELQKNEFYKTTETNFTFDIIYIDGLHTFKQSYRDFLHSIPYSHDKTIWIFDDTIPWDPFSAHPNQNISLKYRALFNVTGHPWHGDVYKTIFAIHELHLNFSYATHIDYGNQQTIVWKTKKDAIRREYGQQKFIKKMTVFDLYENISALNPMPVKKIFPIIGKRIDDDLFSYIDLKNVIGTLSLIPEKNLILDTLLKKEDLDIVSSKIKNIDNELETIRNTFSERKDEISEIERNIAISNKFFDTNNEKIDNLLELITLVQFENNRSFLRLRLTLYIFIMIFVILWFFK